jgi:hypothetical protein
LGDFLTTHLVTLFVQHSRVQINWNRSRFY